MSPLLSNTNYYYCEDSAAVEVGLQKLISHPAASQPMMGVVYFESYTKRSLSEGVTLGASRPGVRMRPDYVRLLGNPTEISKGRELFPP